MAWNAQGARFVAYSPPAVTLPEAPALWRTLHPTREPDNTQRVRAPTLQSSANGPLKDVQFQIASQPGRIDLVAGPLEALWTEGPPPSLPVDMLLQNLTRYAHKTLEDLPAIRVALVVDLIQEAASAQDSNKILLDALPFLKISPLSREVNFQVNVPRAFEFDASRTMFRLSRWSTVVLQIFNVNAAAGAMGAVPAFVAQRHATTLQLDFSSEPVGIVALDKAAAHSMLDELGAEVEATLAEGYDRFSR